MHNPKRELQDFRRFEEVLTILTKEGFGFLLDTLNLSRHVPLTTRIMNQKRETRPERLRETIEKLGTTYIKFGQIMAERPDMIPERYTEELKKLQDSVEPFSSDEAIDTVSEEIGMEKFEEFEEEPLAAASIAQVHRARLESGEQVIVKIRRPGVKEQVEKDLDILNYLAETGEKHLSHVKQMDLVKFVNEFSNWTRQELDMEKECLNAQIFKENMENEENIYIPEVYPELTTEKVLVMEYVEGVKCTEEEKLEQMEIDRKQIAETAIRAGMRQSMIDGFFHADPHPSNFLISEDGKIIYLDFGMMGKVSKGKSEKLGLMLLYMIREDIDGIMDCLEDLGTKTEDFDREKAESKVEEKVLVMKNTSLKHHSITKQMFQLFVELSDAGLQMPSNLALMGKSLVTMEGIGLTVYPDFRITEEYEEMVKDFLRENNSEKELAEDFAIDMIKNKDLITKLPSKLNRKLEEQGKPEINVSTEKSRENIFPATMFLSGTALIISSIYSRILMYFGLLILGYGIYIQRKE
ncbi:MAG: ubiquinone biosynthesis protein [Candidatus Nanohaloarchaea archaeon]|jgi:ubiquinone biosynthesis protein